MKIQFIYNTLDVFFNFQTIGFLHFHFFVLVLFLFISIFLLFGTDEDRNSCSTIQNLKITEIIVNNKDLQEKAKELFKKTLFLWYQNQSPERQNISESPKNVPQDSKNILEYLTEAMEIVIIIGNTESQNTDSLKATKREKKNIIENDISNSVILTRFVEICGIMQNPKKSSNGSENSIISETPGFGARVSRLLINFTQKCILSHLDKEERKNAECYGQRAVEQIESESIIDISILTDPAFLIILSKSFSSQDSNVSSLTGGDGVSTALRLLRTSIKIKKWNIENGFLNLEIGLLLLQQLKYSVNRHNEYLINNSDNNSVDDDGSGISTDYENLCEAYSHSEIAFNVASSSLTHRLSENGDEVPLPSRKKKNRNVNHNDSNNDRDHSKLNDTILLGKKGIARVDSNKGLRLSDAPFLYQQSTELLYCLDLLRLNSSRLSLIWNERAGISDCNLKKEEEVVPIVEANEGKEEEEEVEVEEEEEAGIDDLTRVDYDEDNEEIIKLDNQDHNDILELNDENCDDKVETMTNNVECIDSTKSYKLYLQGCHWFPSSPLQPN